MTTDLPTPVRTAIDAVNGGDTDAFVSGFDADGVVDDWGREFGGHEAIRSWSDAELIGKNATLDVDDVTVDEERVVVHAQVGGDGFNGPSTFTFLTAGGRILRMTITE